MARAAACSGRSPPANDAGSAGQPPEKRPTPGPAREGGGATRGGSPSLVLKTEVSSANTEDKEEMTTTPPPPHAMPRRIRRRDRSGAGGAATRPDISLAGHIGCDALTVPPPSAVISAAACSIGPGRRPQMTTSRAGLRQRLGELTADAGPRRQ